MEFEYDPQKSQANCEKHGIDFEVAQELWDDPDAIGFPARSDDEERFALLGIVREKLWMAFYTRRSGRIRLISVRRARTDERKLYESK
jgi:uncharacterized DUF497 family protein